MEKKCIYCNKDFATKQVLICHHNTCINLLKHNYNNQINTLTEKLNSSQTQCQFCKELEEKFNKEISEYKKQVMLLIENQNKLIDQIINKKNN